jgi:hypothetical protein
VKDYRDLLARRDIDAVIIATPCDLHVAMALAALQAVKHLRRNRSRGWWKWRGRGAACFGQQMRSVVQLRRAIGDVIMVKAQRHAPADLPHDFSPNDWFFAARRPGDVTVEM